MSKVLFIDGITVRTYGSISSEEAADYVKHLVAEHYGKGTILAIHIHASSYTVVTQVDIRTNPAYHLRLDCYTHE